MSGPMMQNAILAAVAGLLGGTGLQVHSTILKAGVVVKFCGGRWGEESMWFNLGDSDAVERAVAHAAGYVENQMSEGGAA